MPRLFFFPLRQRQRRCQSRLSRRANVVTLTANIAGQLRTIRRFRLRIQTGFKPSHLATSKVGRLTLQHDYVINHTQIARVYVINTHASAGFDRRLNDFTRFVHNVTGPVENIPARLIRPVLANNERFEWLITGSRAFFSCRCDDR